MDLYFDLDGQPITMQAWAALMEQRRTARASGESLPEEDPTRIGSDHVGEVWVSTVWLGLNHNYSGDGPPLIFETMVFDGAYDGWQSRYSTKEQSRAGHEAVVVALREGRPLDEALS